MEAMNVPEAIATRIEEQFQDAMSNLPENYGGCIDTCVQPICHESYDGFIPFTNGGFDLTVPTDLRSAWGSGSYPANEKMREYLEGVVETSQQDALECFVQENKTVLEELFPDADLDKPVYDLINYHDLYKMDRGDLAERLSEIEDEWLSEGSTFFYQMRAMFFSADNARNVSGEDEILFLAGTNTDFEYGRDSGLEVTYENNVPVSLLTIEMIDDIVTEMVDSI
jgi:hypothetical protein